MNPQAYFSKISPVEQSWCVVIDTLATFLLLIWVLSVVASVSFDKNLHLEKPQPVWIAIFKHLALWIPASAFLAWIDIGFFSVSLPEHRVAAGWMTFVVGCVAIINVFTHVYAARERDLAQKRVKELELEVSELNSLKSPRLGSFDAALGARASSNTAGRKNSMPPRN
jgi:hypothetical protein